MWHHNIGQGQYHYDNGQGQYHHDNGQGQYPHDNGQGQYITIINNAKSISSIKIIKLTGLKMDS